MLKILGITFLATSVLCFYDKTKAYIKEKMNESAARSIRNLELKRIHKQREKECSSINGFTICLSLDYRVKKDFSLGNKAVINKAVFARMTELLKKRFSEIEVRNLENMLIIFSNNFVLYDNIYSSILYMLSKMKSEIDKKYRIYMIPSITTDAFDIKPEAERIKKDHQNIKHCNLINTSCTTNAFAKKYRFLNQDKYSGKPIGEYSVLDKERENNYLLNMVNKNLSRQLESLGQ